MTRWLGHSRRYISLFQAGHEDGRKVGRCELGLDQCLGKAMQACYEERMDPREAAGKATMMAKWNPASLPSKLLTGSWLGFVGGISAARVSCHPV